jgi:hypothetical protein
MAAVLRDKGGEPWTEDDWNDDAVKAVEERGEAAGVLTMYGASKTLAEKGKTIVTLPILRDL